MTTALDEVALRNALGRAAASATAAMEDAGDFGLRVDHRIAVHERREVRRRRAVAGALAAFVLVLGVLAATVGTRRERIVPVTPHPPGWSSMAPAPIQPRTQYGAIWTGTELFVFGGFGAVEPDDPRSRGAGAATYDPATDTWRQRRSPDHDLQGAVAVWTGTEVLVLAHDGTLHGYDPDADRWLDLAPAPLTGPGRSSFGGVTTPAVWTGSELLVAVADEPGGAATGGSAAYDPATDAWRTLPPPPHVLQSGPDAVWDGTELIVAAQDRSGGPPMHLDALDPATGAWTTLPNPPFEYLDHGFLGFLAWTGTEVIAGGGWRLDPTTHVPDRYAEAAAYDPVRGTWRSLPDAPVPITGQVRAPEAWTGSELLVWEVTDNPEIVARPVLLDPVAGTWRLGSLAPDQGRQGAPAVWTGTELVWWSGEPVAGDADPNVCSAPVGNGVTYTP